MADTVTSMRYHYIYCEKLNKDKCMVSTRLIRIQKRWEQKEVGDRSETETQDTAADV